MEASLTDTLCTRCGLCCDGSLFADVELSGHAEATRLEILGLEVEGDDADRVLLSQPCAALVGRRCGIYPHRPKCCRSFECGLLQDVRRGTVSVERANEHVEAALGQVQRANTLLLRLGERDPRLPMKERAAEALARDTGTSPGAIRARAELSAVMSTLGTMIRRVFLRGETKA